MTWQPAAILYPDAELVCAPLLRTLLASEGETDVWVGRKLPGTRPARAVQVVRDGGPSGELRDIARMRILIWDTTDAKVGALAQKVIAVAPRMVGQSGVLRVTKTAGPFEVPDAAPKRQVGLEIEFRGEAL